MQNKRYHIIIASVIFAVLMWISINMGYEYTVVKYVPVVLENMREEQTLKYPVPKTLTVRFRGTGWQLANIYLSPNVKYYIDGQSLTTREFTVTAKDLPEHVKLPLSVQTLDVSPDTMTLALDDYLEKRVPIESSISINPKDGFGQVGAVRITPESVVVSGGKTMLEAIDHWQTERRRYDNQRSAIDEDVPLEDPLYYSIDIYPQSVRVQADIQHFAEKTFSGVPLSTAAVPSNREVIFIPPKMDVIVRGGIDQLSKLSNNDFQATVDYSALMADSSGIAVPVLSAPQTIKVIRRMPEQFQFIIRKKL